MTRSPVARRARPGRSQIPGLVLERGLWEAGHGWVVGVDEVGRGSWAGPISVGAAVLPRDRRVYGVRDSKALTAEARERLFDRLTGWCRAWGVGHASVAECDALGMAEAQRLAAGRAVAMVSVGLGAEAHDGAAVVDGRWDFLAACGFAEVRRVVRADVTCLSVATASVLAKVVRDRIMRAEGAAFPGYDFDRNKGYPCPRHRAALAAWGPTTLHRRAWVFMDGLAWTGVPRLVRPDEVGDPGSSAQDAFVL
ncbi:MAG: ribonuclease HII [Acidimicrobiales bacterium]